jgi:hypothetical protein
MTWSKKTAAHYRARMMGLAVVMSAASLGTLPARKRFIRPPASAIATTAQTSIHKQPPHAETAPVSIALERAAAKAGAPVPCAPKARAT